LWTLTHLNDLGLEAADPTPLGSLVSCVKGQRPGWHRRRAGKEGCQEHGTTPT